MTLSDDIQTQLRRRGHVQVLIESDAEAAEWRQAARKAARQLGRPVETLRRGRVVLASLKDWPANELEAQVDFAALQRVMNKMPVMKPIGPS